MNKPVSSPDLRGGRQIRSSPCLFSTITWMLIVLTLSILSFYVGVCAGIQVKTGGQDPCGKDGSSQLADHSKKYSSAAPNEEPRTPPNNINAGSSLFSKSLSHFVHGLARVSKGDLMQTYDFGVPPNANTDMLDALILYTTLAALPSYPNTAGAARHKDPTKPLPLLSATTATENCDTMNVIFIDNLDNSRQCFALVGGQYSSYHVQHWMRRPDDKGPLDAQMPLKLTSRAWDRGGMQSFDAPGKYIVMKHQERLLTYLSDADNIKSRLRHTLEKMKVKSVVVMTCNHGQSELLMNFACSSRARGLDLHNVLVFPTDSETKELAEGLGLTTFYEEKLMASMPKKASEQYGDSIFSQMMYAKVLCVQLVNELGYDLLFQDVDLVWYKSPLDFFQDKSLPKFDMYFQDDGSRLVVYAPYSANSGFYFVRSNDKTRHLFRHLLYSSDLVDAWHSHQSVLNALMAEYSSVMGLAVKVYSKEMEEFPGGLQFHRKKEVMKKIMNGTSNAYIFHMSWTNNKGDKIKFFQQLGEWYVNDQCIGKQAHEIAPLVSNCCRLPLFKCHYRDKPSKIPCPDSPYTLKDPETDSFW